VIPKNEVPPYIGKSNSWFAKHKDELEANGFPKPIPILDAYDLIAIDAWLDSYCDSLDGPPDFDRRWTEAANG
jgi:hypothetical protein